MTIELVGPKGYVHGWKFVGVPAPGTKVRLSRYGTGTVHRGNATHAHVKMANGDMLKIPHDKGPGPAKLVPAPEPVEKMSDDRAEMGRQARAAMTKAGGHETLFHGTNREFKPGDIIDAKFSRKGVTDLHGGKQYAFASTDPGEATFAGHGSGPGGHVYRVEPVGDYEWDPHQGTSTSRRTGGGFRVVEEVKQWSGEKMGRPFDYKSMTPKEKKAYVNKGIVPAGMEPPPKRVVAHSSRLPGIELARPGSYRPPAVPAYRPTGTMRKATAASMRKLADDLESRHPDLGAHVHVRDAASALERNQPDGANRHLTAAIGNMQPQSLRRHGLLTDEHHDSAKRSMDAIHRHMLLVKDIQDLQARNDALPRRGETEPYGDDLDEKPSAREPGSKAMNAPARADGGGSDPAVAEPKSVTKWEVTKQVAASNGDLTVAIELAAGDDCYRCGTPNAPDARHCKRCGFAMEPRQPYDRFASEDVTCPNCGRGDDADAVFCDQCGKRMQSYAAFANEPHRYKHGWIKLDAGSAAEAVLPGAGSQLGTGPGPKLPKLSPGQRKMYDRLRSLGHSHGRAMSAVRKIGGALDAGGAVESMGMSGDLTTVIELAFRPTEKRDLRGQWVKDLGDLADEMDRNHPGEKPSLGDKVRAARDAVQRGDYSAAGDSLYAAQQRLRDPSFYSGGKGDATYRNALGENYQLAGHLRRTNAVMNGQVEMSSPMEFARHFNPAQPRDRHGKWTNTGLNVGKGGFTASGAHDPTSMIGVGGGRKNWENEASQMPDRGVRRDFPGIARRMRLQTPARTYMAQLDDTRISNGEKPLHPELAEIFPGVYGKAGITARPGTLSRPKAPRVRPDSYKVTGLDAPQVTYAKMGIKQMLDGSNPVDLSAQTGALASTPHPFGKPGGPGLWHQKGMELPPYIQNIARAILREGRAKSLGEAIAIAKSSTAKWAVKSKHPEVRAASAATNADWDAKRARAHAHANVSAVVRAIELTGTAAGAAKDPRTPLGTFGTGSGTTSASSSQSGARTTKGGNAAKKADLLKQAAGYRRQADALIAERDAMRKALVSASGKTSKGQKGSKTSTNSTTRSSAPASSGTAAKSSAASGKTPAKAAKPSTGTKPSLAAINALDTQILALQAKYKQAIAQAAKL